MITPTNGRIVWFTPSRTGNSDIGNMVQLDPKQPLAAQVCHVFGDRMVNLLVTDSNGFLWPVTSVDLVQTEADLAAVQECGRYAEWMPFQKGQAAKTETIEARQGPG